MALRLGIKQIYHLNSQSCRYFFDCIQSRRFFQSACEVLPLFYQTLCLLSHSFNSTKLKTLPLVFNILKVESLLCIKFLKSYTNHSNTCPSPLRSTSVSVPKDLLRFRKVDTALCEFCRIKGHLSNEVKIPNCQ